tara:strand:+ start:2191 stop:2649 length:459 start_codon:yes stop_codon:yes gene_type:complete
MKTKEFIAEYDVSDYIYNQIEFFKNDKQEFLVSKLWNEERDVSSVTDEEIEKHFYDDVWIGQDCYDCFLTDLEEEFTKHIGKNAHVEGRKMGWRNLSGEKFFTINKPIDMFEEIAPDCEITYKIEKVKEGEYEVRIAHHDSPMGEYYNIKIK